MPALSARCASSVAYSPATEMSATLGSSSRRRAETSERGGSRSGLPGASGGGRAAAGELLLGGLQRLLSATSSLSASTATMRSDGPAPDTSTPRASSTSRLAAVPIPISQPSTPSRPRRPRAMPMSLTLSA